jgi:flavin reductase (DIM6/NTAB) family NADH-FMN oxidoreductase RutF
MNRSACELEPEESEFPFTGLESAPSTVVRPPRVRNSPACLECRLLHHLPLATGPGAANLVVGEVVHLHLAPEILDEQGFADPEKLDLIGRLGGSEYCRTRDRFELQRP